jgi:hypothetical protein
MAAPTAASATTGYYSSSQTLKQGLEQLVGEIHEDGGTVDGLIEHYHGELPDTTGDDVKNALERVLASDYAEQDLYEGLEGETLVTKLKLGSDEPLDSWLSHESIEHTIETRANTLVEAVQAEPVDGDVAQETGGELADIANDATPLVEANGSDWVAGGLVGLLTVTLGSLVYDDIQTGTNPVLTLLGIDTGPDANAEEEAQAEQLHLPPIEEPRWVFLPKVTNGELKTAGYNETMKGVWEYVNTHRSRWHLPESWYWAPDESATFEDGPVGNPERSLYVLTTQVEGRSQNFSAAAEGAGPAPEPYGHVWSESFGYASTESQCFGNLLPENGFVSFDADGPRGWPTEGLQNVGYIYGSGPENWAICTEYGPYPGGYGYNSVYGGARFQVATVRTPAQMRLELPHKVSSGELPSGTGETHIEPYEGDEGLTSSIEGLAKALARGEDGSAEKLLERGENGEPLPGSVMEHLAKALVENNPSAELTTKEAEDVAEQCLQDTMLAGESESTASSDCESLPIFASGSDVPAATEHDLKALALHPAWAKLNYENGAEKEEKESRTWYKGVGGCSATPPAGEQCDEYPFWASQQGGPSAIPTPNLEYINAEDNEEQGRKYGNFVTSCKMAERSSTDYAFLAIPVPPRLGIPTTRLCN